MRLRRTVAAMAILVTAGCGAGADSASESLPSVAASPADTPTPPVTTPPTAGTTAGAPSSAGSASSRVPASAAPATSAAVPPGSGRVGPCAAAKLSLTSDKPSYAPGRTVHLTATLVNSGTTSCTIQAGAQRGFTVTRGSTTVWASGCSAAAGGHTATLPCPQFIALMPVKAGQTLTRTQDWSEQADGSVKQVAAGSYVVGETWGGLSASVPITIS